MNEPIEIKHVDEGIIIEYMDRCTISVNATRWPWCVQKLIGIAKGGRGRDIPPALVSIILVQ
jgi:hypothetical protein